MDHVLGFPIFFLILLLYGLVTGGMVYDRYPKLRMVL